MAHKTPLYDEHVERGGKMIDFAGWQLPVHFEGLRAEHYCVRHHVGLFDVSHMGELRVTGPQALASLKHLLCSPVEKLEAGQAQYSLMLNEQGGVVDDLIVYCFKKNENYLLCVNAVNVQKDYEWILKHNQGARVEDESSQWAQIAIQGPEAMPLVELMCAEAASLKKFEFCVDANSFVWARTGYTGEKGVELFVPWGEAPGVWQNLLAKGRELKVAPIGLSARDTLRVEMCYSLYGHEIDEQTLPTAAGLKWVLKKEGHFLGREFLQESSEKLVAFVLDGLRVPRLAYKVFSIDKQVIGRVTSGTYSPSLGVGVGMAYVQKNWAHVGAQICIDFRGRPVGARVVRKPFVRARV